MRTGSRVRVTYTRCGCFPISFLLAWNNLLKRSGSTVRQAVHLIVLRPNEVLVLAILMLPFIFRVVGADAPRRLRLVPWLFSAAPLASTVRLSIGSVVTHCKSREEAITFA